MLTSSQFLLIDKPAGRSSFSVVAEVRRISGIKRVGHCGTLDPFATGLLIILVGRQATKHQADFLHMDKKYECTAEFGCESDTYDNTGELQKVAEWEDLQRLTELRIRELLPTFTGHIVQQVPAFSAVKRQGQKLYDMARKGSLDLSTLPSRTVNVFEFELTELKFDEDEQKVFAKFFVHCSSGTYIRSLVHDLGKLLKVGAVATQLRRTAIGPYTVDQAKSLASLSSEMFQGIL